MQKKLPENAKLVFKGVIYDVYQWEQEMFDGSKATFEKLKRKDTATIIAIVDDKIMLLDQEQPHKGRFLSFPGGVVDRDESTEQAASRELLEETGYEAGSLELWKRINPMSAMIWNNDCYVARHCRKKQEQNLDNGEKISVRFIDFEEFLMLSEDDNFRHRDIKNEFFYFRLHPDKKEEFRKFLFGE